MTDESYLTPYQFGAKFNNQAGLAYMNNAIPYHDLFQATGAHENIDALRDKLSAMISGEFTISDKIHGPELITHFAEAMVVFTNKEDYDLVRLIYEI